MRELMDEQRKPWIEAPVCRRSRVEHDPGPHMDRQHPMTLHPAPPARPASTFPQSDSGHTDVGWVHGPGRAGLLRIDAELAVEDEQIELVPESCDDLTGDCLSIRRAPVVEDLGVLSRNRLSGRDRSTVDPLLPTFRSKNAIRETSF